MRSLVAIGARVARPTRARRTIMVAFPRDGDEECRMRPLIGISTYREQARWGYWDVPAVLLPADYADAVADAGGEPVLLPAASVSPGVVARLDGLVLAGGADVEPARYGEQPG